ncbi:MAG TPA: DUF1573 domain-containing protein [Bacteroidia bacterium]|jgi:hypothetical protein
MKKLFCFLLLPGVLTLASCGNKPTQDKMSTENVNIPDGDALPGTSPVMTFGETKHDFGTITEGEKVSYTFKFKNTGGSDLVITSARGSCGCTVPEFPKDPVKPNQEGVIHVTFDSSGKDGMQHKDVTIVTNAQPNTKIIQITANVMKKEDKPDNDK